MNIYTHSTDSSTTGNVSRQLPSSRMATGLLLTISSLALLCLVFLLPGCGPATRIDSSWVQQPLPEQDVKKVLVIALAREEVARNLWENVFVDQLKRSDIEAIPSHPLAEKPIPPKEAAIRAIVDQAGADAVLITHLIDSQTSTKWHPGTPRIEPSAFYSGIYGYYGEAYNTVYTTPTTSTRTVVNLETNLYDVATGKLLWAARSSTVNPKLLRSDFESVARKLIGNMQQKGVMEKMK